MKGLGSFLGFLAIFGGVALASSVFPGNALIAGALGFGGVFVFALLAVSRNGGSGSLSDQATARQFAIIGAALLLALAYAIFRLTGEEKPVGISLLGHAIGTLTAGCICVLFLARKSSI